MERRRRIPRIATDGWSGQCGLDGRLTLAWAACSVIDISLLGFGVELSSDERDVLVGYKEIESLVGSRLVVTCEPPVGHSVSLRLVGTVRNQNEVADGKLRIGLEFDHLAETEKAILDVIEKLHLFW